MLKLGEDDVRRLLPMAEAMRLVEDAWAALAAGTAQNQPRRRLVLPEGSVLHQMAGAWGGYFGTKIYSTHARHGAHFFFLLFEASTGAPAALIEANWLGQVRTGAASGVATKYLAAPDASAVAIIGTGFQARSQIQAVRLARPVSDVRVWSRNRDRRETFARDQDARACQTAEEALAGAQIIVTATFAKDPVLESAWVRDGAHINAMGSNHPQRRELPPDLIARAGLVAVDTLDQARIESGDLILAWKSEDWESPRVVEMKDVVTGKAGRSSPHQITIFKSNGLAVQDVAVAAYVYERARAEGLGT